MAEAPESAFRSMAGDRMDTLLREVATEIARQDQIHPRGYPPTRDGVFLGLTTAQWEIEREAPPAWSAGRCKCPTPECGHHDWGAVRGEALQAAAILLRLVRSIECLGSVNRDSAEQTDGH